MSSDLHKYDITIRYIQENHPNIRSIRTPAEVARHLFYEWWDERYYGKRPEILDITVDGQVFKSLEDTK